MTVSIWFITVTVPIRAELPALAATVHVKVPFPVPLAPAVIVSQLEFETADHGHPVEVVTPTVLLVPAAGAATSGPCERA